ncbi:MAG: hypothetical protein ACI4ET_10285 [Bilifractor sp.]
MATRETTETKKPLDEKEVKKPAAKRASYKGDYKVNPANGLNIRDNADGAILTAIPQDHVVTCMGKKMVSDVAWLHIKTEWQGKEIEGYCNGAFLSKI